jgi:hypothetical protein
MDDDADVIIIDAVCWFHGGRPARRLEIITAKAEVERLANQQGKCEHCDGIGQSSTLLRHIILACRRGRGILLSLDLLCRSQCNLRLEIIISSEASTS